MRAIRVLALSLALHLRTSLGFSFTIDNTPQQCSDLSISIVGSGQPPYTAVIVPYGSSPLPNGIEARGILVVPFGGASTSASFQLTYPGSSQFVAVVSKPAGSTVEQVKADKLPQVSDGTGFGAGGASAVVQVQTSSDSSCYSSTQNASQSFGFSTTPDNQLTQCASTRIYWDAGTAKG